MFSKGIVVFFINQNQYEVFIQCIIVMHCTDVNWLGIGTDEEESDKSQKPSLDTP